MSRPLVIVDSEAKGRALRESMEGGIDLLQLTCVPFSISCREKKDKLKKEPPRFNFNPLPAGEDFVATLESAYDREIIIALDNSTEGGYLAWLINSYVVDRTDGKCKPRYIRIVGLTPEEIKESLETLEPFKEKTTAGYFVRGLFDGCFRKHLQRLIGTGFGPDRLALNLTSLTTMFFLADRDIEIKAFAPALKWEVNLVLKSADNEFKGRLVEAPGDVGNGYFLEPEKVKSAVESFRNGPIVVEEIIEDEMAVGPPGICSLTSLIEEAYIKHRISPTRVVEYLRMLQHGIEVGGRFTGLVSVPGSLEKKTGERFFERIRAQVAGEFGSNLLVDKRTDLEGEQGLYPLRPEITEKEVAAVIGDAGSFIYGIIRRRALASQMSPANIKTVHVTFKAEGECFIAADYRIALNDGYMTCYRGIGERAVMPDHSVPALEVGQRVDVSRILPEKSPGFPPEYYTLESLFADLADFSITAGDAAGVLEQLLVGGYIHFDEDGAIHCGKNVAILNAVIARAFSSMVGINLSAYIEQTIAEALSGRKPLDFALQQFDQTLFMQGNVLVKVKVADQLKSRGSSSRIIKSAPVQEVVASVEKVDSESIDEPTKKETGSEGVALPGYLIEADPREERTIVTDPREHMPSSDGADVAEGPGGDGQLAPDDHLLDQKFDVSSDDIEADWPDEVKELFSRDEQGIVPGLDSQVVADGARAAAAEVAEKQETRNCPVCSRVMILKEDRFGRFWSCSGFPACRHSETCENDALPDLDCPICGTGKVISKITPTGKSFYVCPETDCEFMAWSRPHPVSCGSCGSPFLVEKKVVGDSKVLRCPRAGCLYTTPLDGSGGAVQEAETPVMKGKVRVRRVGKGAVPATGGTKRKVRIIRRKKG